MFRFLLTRPDGERTTPPRSSPRFPTWPDGSIITLGRGQQLRVVAANAVIDKILIEQGFNGTLVVEPMDVAAPPV